MNYKTQEGVVDAWAQHASAGILFLYALVLACGIFEGTLAVWLNAFWMRGLGFVASVSVLVHAWIGIWTVIGDYVPRRFQRMAMGLLKVFLGGYGLLSIWWLVA